MGHYCRICGRERPNEQFSGKGHRIHVCKRCNAKPKSERQAIEDKDDIFGFMRQSHISERNVARLEQMTKSKDPQVASLAAIVLKVARVKPYKTRRLKFLAQMHPELLRNLEDAGLVPAHTRDSETTEVPAQAYSEETEIFAREDLEARSDLSAQEDWEIPF
jgi:ribosome-binding protein aMBF1 (putative translation factor)